MANIQSKKGLVPDASAETGLPEEMSQDTGVKGGEAEARSDADDIEGPMSLKDWLWLNKQPED